MPAQLLRYWAKILGKLLFISTKLSTYNYSKWKKIVFLTLTLFINKFYLRRDNLFLNRVYRKAHDFIFDLIYKFFISWYYLVILARLKVTKLFLGIIYWNLSVELVLIIKVAISLLFLYLEQMNKFLRVNLFYEIYLPSQVWLKAIFFFNILIKSMD